MLATCLADLGPGLPPDSPPLEAMSKYMLAADIDSSMRKKQTRLFARKARGLSVETSQTLVKKSCPAPPDCLCPEPAERVEERIHRAI